MKTTFDLKNILLGWSLDGGLSGNWSAAADQIFWNWGVPVPYTLM